MHDLKEQKTYRLSTFWLLDLFWFFGCLVVGRSIFTKVDTIINKPELWYIGILDTILIYFLYFMFRMVQDFRLRISEDGIQLIVFSRSIYATWAQIKRKGQAYLQNQLFLDNPTVIKRKEWRYLPDLFSIIGKDSFNLIPFSKMTWQKYDELEAEVRNRVPHLFVEEK